MIEMYETGIWVGTRLAIASPSAEGTVYMSYGTQHRELLCISSDGGTSYTGGYYNNYGNGMVSFRTIVAIKKSELKAWETTSTVICTNHNYQKTAVVKPQNNGGNGYVSYSCSKCGKSYSRNLVECSQCLGSGYYNGQGCPTCVPSTGVYGAVWSN